ncbi:MAG: transketolase family protein [Candidatus Pacebacteria bacterium]|nr:transketolase family protein [Candidatus Paceibacterota bacterium]
MINSDLNLHPDLFNSDVLSRRPIRDGFGEAIVELAEKDERIVVLCADVTDSVRLTVFKERFPERYIEMGVAEQNMAAVAAGLAQYGKIPFIVAYSAFSPGRNWEQIRTTIALSDLPVKIIGMHTGVSVGPDGATHQMLEDITLMRVLPNMHIEVPMDAEEARKAVLAVAHNGKPTYVRFTRHDTPVLSTVETSFAEGRSDYLWHSREPQVAFIGAGPVLYDALCVARDLDGQGVGSIVLNTHSIKPMDIERVKETATRAGAIVSLEEHQILGGIGGTLAEIFAQNTPTPMEMVAVHDRFGQSGEPGELAGEYRLDRDAITDAVRRVLERKH